MKIEKQLTIIAVISIIITAILFFVLDKKAGSGLFNTVFELVLMTGMTFLVIAINFFAIRFFIRKLTALFRKKQV
jgi:hypothetical protein